jgi:hypothetical protein
VGRRAVAIVLVGALIAADACSNGGYASSCPGAVLPDCPIAPGVSDCSRSDLVCGLDSLPTGTPCSAPAQCSMLIDPCPNWQKYTGERADGYVCSCLDGHWSCDDCSMGAGLCAEAPDGAPLVSPVLVDGAADVVDADAESGLAVGADAAFDGQGPAQCQWLGGDAAEVTVAFTGSELEAGPGDAIIEWFDDAGVRESCGPTSCDARCPPGAACSAAFITHALVHGGGTCL